MDIWTSHRAEHAYLSLTAHWWQPDDVRGGEGEGRSDRQGEGRRAGHCRALLHAEVLDVAHTSANIAAAIQPQLDEWVGRDVTRGFLVTDGGSNVRAAARALGLRRISCAAHLLHLVVKDALGLGSENPRMDAETRTFRHLLQKCRHIVSHFSRSVKDTFLLREKQALKGVPEHRLIAEVVTRWNSTYAMLERLVEQKEALVALFRENEVVRRESQLNQEDWLTVSQAVEVLKPFKDFTLLLSSDTATLALVIPMIRTAHENLATLVEPTDGRAEIIPAVRALVRRLQEGLRVRLDPLCQQPVYMLATMCDPRIKGSIAERAGNLTHWRDALSQRVERLQALRGTLPRAGDVGGESSGAAAPAVHPPPPLPGDIPPRATATMTLEMELIGRAVGPSLGRRTRVREDTAAAMVRDYLAEPYELQSTNPLSYWTMKESVWPDLSSVAQELLSCPPTSVQSERVFSRMGNIVDPHRSSLAPWSVQQLIFLQVNMELFNFPQLDFEVE